MTLRQAQYPAEWENKQLGELAELKGRIGWRGLTAKEYTESGPLFLSVHSLNYGDYVDFRDAFHISEERYVESPEIMLQEDDVLICKDGAGIGKVGILGMLPDRATINSSLLLIRSGNSILPKFLYHCLSSPYFQKIVNSRLNGATTPHLYQRDITEFPVVLPPLPDQHRIVAILDEAFDNIATAKANAEKNLQNTRALFENHLQSVFTQRGDGWEEKRFGDVCEYVNGKAHEQCIDEDGQFIIINSKFISTEGKVFKRSNKALLLLQPDDIAMVLSDVPKGKAFAKCFLVGEANKYTLNQRICLIRSKKFHTKFLFYQLNRNRHFLAFDNGENQTNMRLNQVLSCPLFLPPIPEQVAIAARLDSMKEETQRLESLYQQKLAALDELKKSLLHQAFTGKL